MADVGGKLAHGLRVHAGTLHYAVRHQADGGEGRFQLVRGVGDEAAALPLVIVQPLGELVEFVSKLRYLVLPARGDAVAVITRGDYAHGADKLLQAPEKQL